MSKIGKYEDYDYVEEETVKRACMGDEIAQTEVIKRYDHYVRRVFRTVARSSFNVDPNSIPMDSLMQDVWMKILDVIEKKFH